MKNKLIYFFLFLMPCIIFAQLSEYDWQAPLSKTTDTWHVVPLNTSIFEKTKDDFSDIRMYGITEKDTLEVPFVLKSSAPSGIEEEITFKLLNSTSNASGYFYTYAVPVEQAINKIELSFKNDNFDWKLDLEGSQNQNQWFTILEDYRIVSIQNSQTNYTFSDLVFPNAKYAYLRIHIKGSDKPLLASSSILSNKVIPATYITYPKKEKSISQKGKATVIDIDLKGRLPISYLKINVLDDYDYYRPVTVSYVSDSVKTEKGWKYTYRNLFSSTLTSLEDTGFKFRNSLLNKIKIRIENYDNPALKIGTIDIKGYSYELVGRFTEPAQYYLVYGNKNAYAPRYDLQQTGFELPSNSTVLVVGNEEKIKKPIVEVQSALFENKWWLWAIMGIVILVLGGATLKMMKEKK